MATAPNSTAMSPHPSHAPAQLGDVDIIPVTSTGLPAACLDTHDAAIYIGVSYGTLANWRSRGTGPVYLRMGDKAIRYLVSDLDDYLAHTRATTRTRR